MTQFKATVMDEAALNRAVRRISHEIIERNKGVEGLVLVGIQRRGLPLAQMIRQNVAAIEGVTLPLESLNIRFYRDDLTRIDETPQVGDAIEMDGANLRVAAVAKRDGFFTLTARTRR